MKKVLTLSVLAMMMMTFSVANAKTTRRNRVTKKTVAKKVVNKKAVAKRPAAESYTCGAERITVTYPTTKTAKVVTKAGKVYNLNVAVSGSGARYVSKRGDIEFFKGGKDAIFRGPNNIEKSCTRR